MDACHSCEFDAVATTLGPWNPLHASCSHEAGHTIVGREIGRPVIFVRASVKGRGVSLVQRRDDADDLVIGLAGGPAERHYCELVSEGAPSSPDDGRHFVWGAKTDYDETIALARHIAEKGDQTAGDLINWAGTQAEALVEQCLDSILSFAQMLYDNGGTLMGEPLTVALSACGYGGE